jgi:hypothetical protein
MSDLIDPLRACRPQAIFAAPQPHLDVRWVLLILGGAWVAMSFLFAGAGWSALAAEYRSTAPRLGKPLRCSMVMGRWPWSVFYRGMVHVRLDATGLTLSVFPLFRLFHPPLFIPWSDVSECKRETFLLAACASISLSRSKMIRMRFLGQAGQAISEMHARATDATHSGA